MIIPIEPGEREDGDVAAGDSPEKGFLVLGPGRYAAASRDAVRQARLRAHLDAVPKGGAQDPGPGADLNAAEHARGGVEAGRRLSEEDTLPVIEVPASLRKGSSALERFERRAQEIARAAEIGVRALMQDETQFFPPPVEQRLPEVRDQGRLAGRDAPEQPGREHADPGVEQGPWAADAEGRDAIPFGLKRRVYLRVPIFRDEERRGAPRVTVGSDEGREVGLDRRIGVDDEKVAALQESAGVAQRAGGAEDLGLPEKRELRQVRRFLAQLALDLVAQVMEINRYFADAGLAKPPQMCDREGNVEKW
jgi:hypothetical protein